MATTLEGTASRIPRRKRQRKRSFTEALKEKYCAVDELPTGGFVIDIVVMGKPKHNGTDAELGFLRNVVLCKSNVSHAGIPAGGLQSLCPNVTDLDLSSNLLDNWLDILNIMTELPHLKFVNLSGNILHDPGDTFDKWGKPVKNVENLVLNKTGIKWEDVACLARHMPGLQELHVCSNGYDVIEDCDITPLSRLECLRMNDNAIRRWDEVWKLQKLAQLKTLVLSGNPLEDVFYHYTATDTQPTPQLQHGKTHPKTVKTDSNTSLGKLQGLQEENCELLKECLEYIDTVIEDAVRIVEEGDNKKSAPRDIKEGATSREPLEDSQDENSDSGHFGMERASPRSIYLEKYLKNKSASLPVPNGDDTSMADDFEENGTDERASTNTCEDAVMTEKDCPGETSEQRQTAFPNLQSLCISETGLHSWDHLHAISRFPNLQSLRIKGIKLMKDTPPEDRRKVFVALLPNIKHLNGSEVTLNERDKSERHFLRYFTDKEEKPERYNDLEQKHGPLMPLADLDLGFGYKEWVKLSFVHKNKVVHQANIHVVEPVGKLRTYIANKLKIPSRTFRMYHMPCASQHTPEGPQLDELFLDSLPMSRFDFMEGDQIHIDDEKMEHDYFSKEKRLIRH